MLNVVAAFSILWIAAGAQASATTMTATYDGSVTTALDTTGVFGTVGADLAGSAYRLVYTIDTDQGSYSTFSSTFSDPLLHGDQVFGGISAALTINGHTQTFLGTPSAYDIVATKAGFGQLVQVVNNMSGQAFASWKTTSPGAGFPTSILDSYTMSSCPSASCTASIFFDILTATRGDFHGVLGFGTFSVTSAPIAPTPIPATLPLLVSALGGLGVARWRRGQRTA